MKNARPDIDELKSECERAEAQYRAALKTKRAAALEAAEALRAATVARQRLAVGVGASLAGLRPLRCGFAMESIEWP
jgi:hypothetical protein